MTKTQEQLASAHNDMMRVLEGMKASNTVSWKRATQFGIIMMFLNYAKAKGAINISDGNIQHAAAYLSDALDFVFCDD